MLRHTAATEGSTPELPELPANALFLRLQVPTLMTLLAWKEYSEQLAVVRQSTAQDWELMTLAVVDRGLPDISAP